MRSTAISPRDQPDDFFCRSFAAATVVREPIEERAARITGTSVFVKRIAHRADHARSNVAAVVASAVCVVENVIIRALEIKGVVFLWIRCAPPAANCRRLKIELSLKK